MSNLSVKGAWFAVFNFNGASGSFVMSTAKIFSVSVNYWHVIAKLYVQSTIG